MMLGIRRDKKFFTFKWAFLSFIALGVWFLVAPATHAATITWTGSGNWSTGSNWSGGVAPSASDTAIFSASSTANATIDTSVSVGGIEITSSYTGTITQGSGNTLTVGTSNYSQAGGIFTGSNANITMNGVFSLTGGTFTSTSGNLVLNESSTFSGTFSNSSGTVKLDMTNSSAVVTGSSTFYYLGFGDGNATNRIITVATGTVLTVQSTTYFNSNYSSIYLQGGGEIDAQGDVIQTYVSSYGGASTFNFVLDGTGTQTVSDQNGSNIFRLPRLTINKPSGTVDLSGTLMFTGDLTNLSGASVVNPSTSTVILASPSTTFTGSVSLYNVQISGEGVTSNKDLTIATGTALTVQDWLRFQNSYTTINVSGGGEIDAQGDIFVYYNSGSTNGGSGTIVMDGSGDQLISGTQTNNGVASTLALPNLTIDKTSGVVYPSSTIEVTGNLAVNQGEFRLSSSTISATLQVNGTTTIDASGTLSDYATVTNAFYLGGSLVNDGAVDFGVGSCASGSPQYISIRSTVDGTQRSWSGTGVFSMKSLDVRDQGGTASITTENSVDSGDNGTNWSFPVCAPRVTSISPSSATNTASTSITSISGTNFSLGWDQENGLVGNWRFDEASGSVATDSSGSGNAGTASGTAIVAGKLGNGRSFNGTSDYIAVASSTSLDILPQNTGMSVALWMKLGASQTAGTTILGTNNPGYILWFPSGTSIRFGDHNSHYADASYSFSSGTWYHVVATVASGASPTETFYVNGAEVSSGASPTWASNTSWNELDIGHDADVTYNFDGTLDEVRIYNRALSASEANQLYLATEDPYVSLTKSGQTDIVASSSDAFTLSSSTSLTGGTFDLAGAATGNWNVVVTDPDGQTGTLTNGFTITGTAAPVSSASYPVVGVGGPLVPVSSYDLVIDDISPSSVTITWRTTLPASSSLAYGETSSYGTTLAASSSDSNLIHAVTIDNLTPGTTYHLATHDEAQGFDVWSPDHAFTAGEGGSLASAATGTTGSTSTTTSPTATSSTSSPSVTSLETEIQILLTQLHALQAQLAAAGRGSVTATFTRDLELWDTGQDVKALQEYLISQDKGPAVEALRSHGTTYTFGPLTYAALVEFQRTVGIVPHSGYFGRITRGYAETHPQ